MDLEQVLQNHRFGRRELPPHRVHAALRMDGRLVKITSRTVFRDMDETRTWLEAMVRTLEAAHGSVRMERFRIIVADEEPPSEAEASIASAPWDALDVSRLKERVRARRAARCERLSGGSADSGLAAAPRRIGSS